MSSIGIAMAFVMSFEGFSAYPYMDGNGWAIGYGTQISPKRAKELRLGVGMDEAQKWLRNDLRRFKKVLGRLVTAGLTKKQEAALLSLVYNIGPKRLERSRALAALNQGNAYEFMEEAFSEEKGFVKAGGKVLNGLVRRREAEERLFSEDIADL
jgi:lysozyme